MKVESADRPEHLPNYYVSRRSTEAQAFSVWTPPSGTLGALTDEARGRAATLRGRSEELKRAAANAVDPAAFGAALRKGDIAVIAELKRASPSKGVIDSTLDAANQASAYEQGGAAAVSILTEPSRFAGSNEDLVQARAAVRLPLLKKDFHVDPLQLLEARALGASAALIIVRAVAPSELAVLMNTAADIGLEVLVEIRDRNELDRALSLGAKIIGVNNRDLETLEIDPERSLRLLPQIPRDVVAVAESGVRSLRDVEDVAAAGADAVLVGSHVSSATDPESAVRGLTAVPRTGGARKS
ncbi:MAG: indole-3-glycerol-phosphate synthase [Gemmatimonadaceae bacterium]